jgi:hypothetical protein
VNNLLSAEPFEEGFQAGNLPGNASLRKSPLEQIPEEMANRALIHRRKIDISRLSMQKIQKLVQIHPVRINSS